MGPIQDLHYCSLDSSNVLRTLINGRTIFLTLPSINGLRRWTLESVVTNGYLPPNLHNLRYFFHALSWSLFMRLKNWNAHT